MADPDGSRFTATLPRHPAIKGDVPFGQDSTQGVLSISSKIHPDRTVDHFFVTEDPRAVEPFVQQYRCNGYDTFNWTPCQGGLQLFESSRPAFTINDTLNFTPRGGSVSAGILKAASTSRSQPPPPHPPPPPLGGSAEAAPQQPAPPPRPNPAIPLQQNQRLPPVDYAAQMNNMMAMHTTLLLSGVPTISSE